MAIYRRGAIYWWRRTLRVRNPDLHPITVRVSLRTAGAHEAKTRAAHLELGMMTVMSALEPSLRPNLAREDLARIYHLAFKAELDRIILKQAATPMLAEQHAVANLTYAHLFTHLTRCATPPVNDQALVDELISAGLSAEEARNVGEALLRHGYSLPITPNQIGAYLKDAGVYPNDTNKTAVSRIVAAAYRNACLEGSKMLGLPVEPGTVSPLPGNFLKLLGVDAPAHDSAEMRRNAPPAAPVPSSRAGTGDPEPKLDLSISEIAEEALKKKTADGSWDKERRRDVQAAVKLFIAANGDISFATVTQRHLSEMASLFSRLPTRYGFAKGCARTGQEVQETIGEALERGAALRDLWLKDPVAAEAKRLPTVGFSEVTRKKHMTWISALVTYAQVNGRPFPAGLNFKIIRQEIAKGTKNKVTRQNGGQKKNQALAAWSPDDLRHAFTAPVWHGCAGLWNRFEPGDAIIHDACYFAPLIIALHGCRSDEATGLAPDDVADGEETPFIHFRVNALRRIKTAASNRKVPVSPTLIRLGFLDYVRAVRALGHRALFPELHHPKLSFDHNFYDKIFEPWRATMFPNGTSRKRGRKDVDVRSFRATCITHLRSVGCPKDLRQAIVGHEVGDVTSDIYEEDPPPAMLLPWIERLSDLIPGLPAFPLHLRPPEWQKFGAPQGRPRKSSRIDRAVSPVAHARS